ncbi:amino acid permease 4 [Perilla frutescens var. hirtella]|nr:amino acid permease 4 [Perilla frutescens var. hirtella]
MMSVDLSNYFHLKGHNNSYEISRNPFMIEFGVLQIDLSQILNFDQIWWLSVLVAVMSFTYPTIGLGLEIVKFAENGKIRRSFTRVRVGVVTETQKIWKGFQALGAIAFSYFCTLNLIDI